MQVILVQWNYSLCLLFEHNHYFQFLYLTSNTTQSGYILISHSPSFSIISIFSLFFMSLFFLFIRDSCSAVSLNPSPQPLSFFLPLSATDTHTSTVYTPFIIVSQSFSFSQRHPVSNREDVISDTALPSI